MEKNLCSQCSISARLQFHITSDDYFGTLATILSLDRESGEPTGQKVIDDLMHLQRNYKIVKK